MTRSTALLLSGAFYVAVATVWTWPLATAIGTHTALRVQNTLPITRHDQTYSISAAARNAAAIRDGDWQRLLNWRTCYPMPKSATLGEHAIELGILALPGYLATRNPVVAYNTACLLLVLIAALSTFCLVRHWTGSAGAGLFAGLAFAFHPEQINDLTHPFVMGIHWLPLVLLAFERLLDTGQARFAFLLAVAGMLQSCVGSYPLLVLVGFAGPYGVVRLVQLRRLLDRRRIGLLALAVAVVAVAAGALLAQYAGGSAWGIRRRLLILVPFEMLWPGGMRAVGALTVVLAALLPLLRDRRPSPAPALVTAGLCCVLLAGGGQPWPGGPSFGGLYPRLADHVWILGIARVPAAVRSGAYLSVSLLAGLAVGRILVRLPTRRLAWWTAAGLTGLLLVEYFRAPVTRRLHGTPTTVELVSRQPSADVLAAYAAFDGAGLDGAVVDVPFEDHGLGMVGHMPNYTLLAAYHGRETAACFTSHAPPSYFDIDRMVEELRALEPTAPIELAAAGLRNVVVHQSAEGSTAEALGRLPGMQLLYQSPEASALRVTLAVDPHHDVRRLEPRGGRLRWIVVKAYWEPVVELTVRNAGERPWALSRPIAPLPARVRWMRADGEAATSWLAQSTMLPLALAAGATAPIRIPVGTPPADCACRPEIEIPELGWRVTADAIDVSGWTPAPPATAN